MAERGRRGRLTWADAQLVVSTIHNVTKPSGGRLASMPDPQPYTVITRMTAMSRRDTDSDAGSSAAESLQRGTTPGLPPHTRRYERTALLPVTASKRRRTTSR
jgi:hypothetical protein